MSISDGPRTDKLTTGLYDQVIAFTQTALNNTLETTHAKLEMDEASKRIDRELANKLFGRDNENWISNLKMGPPKLFIDWSAGSKVNARLQLSLVSGLASVLYKVVTTDMKMGPRGRPIPASTTRYRVEFNIDNWTVTYPVNIKLVDLKDDTTRGKALLERIEAKKKAGIDHTIYELLIDFGEMIEGDAQVYMGHWQEQDYIWKGLEETDLTTERPPGFELGKERSWLEIGSEYQINFTTLMKNADSYLRETNLRTLGYFVVKKPESPKATFTVSDVRYQTYPWRDKNGTVEPRLNSLLYLEMTDNRPPPDSQKQETATQVFLPEDKGNWTNGTDPSVDDFEKFGTFMLKRERFMDDWLIQKLDPINKLMTLHVEDTTVGVWANVIETKWSWSFSLQLAPSSGINTEFKKRGERYPVFTVDPNWSNEAKTWFESFQNPEQKWPGAIVWECYNVEWGPKNRSDSSGLAKISTAADAITVQRLIVVPGRNQILLEGKAYAKLGLNLKSADLFATEQNYGHIAKVSWQITFTMKSASDGGLVLGGDVVKPTIEWAWDYGVDDDMRNQIIDKYKTAGENFDKFVEKVKNCLEGTEHFAFPAEGVYFFKNPVFTHRGDLVTDIGFNGIPGPKVNPGAAERTAAGNTEINWPTPINISGSKSD